MKTKTLNIVLNAMATIAIFVIAASCNHKDLCYYHPHVAPFKVSVDWAKANGNAQYIEGMTAYLFTKEGMNQKINTTITTNRTHEIIFDVLEGNYSVAVFNGTPEEYSTLKFFDLGEYNNASVQVSETQVPWYSKYKVKSNDKFVAHQPEWIARGLADEIVVTNEMVKKAEQEYIDGGFLMSARTLNNGGDVVPDSLIHTFNLRVQLKGIDNFYRARAIVTGLAIGKQIISMEPLRESVSHYIGMESWHHGNGITTADGIGEIEGSLTCFGLASGYTGAPNDIQLTLEVLLIDNKTIITWDKSLPIGDLIVKEGNNLFMKNAILFPPDLPYVKPEDGSEGGFGVDIGEWEKEEIDILNH